MGRGFLDYEKEHKAFLWQNPLFVLFPKRTYEMDNQTLIWNVKIYDGTGGQPIAGCPPPFPATLCLPVPHYSKMARDNCSGCSQRLSISIPLSEKTRPGNPVRSPWEPCPVAPQSRYSGTGCMDWETHFATAIAFIICNRPEDLFLHCRFSGEPFWRETVKERSMRSSVR